MSRIDNLIETLNSKIGEKNDEIKTRIGALKKNRTRLAVDEFSHYKHLNNMVFRFLENFSFEHEHDKDGFLTFGEQLGKTTFLGLFFNFDSKNIDMNNAVGENFDHKGVVHTIKSIEMVNKRVLLLGNKNSDGKYVACKSIVTFYKINTEESSRKKAKSFSEVFRPLSNFHKSLSEEQKSKFFGMCDQELDFEEAKSFTLTDCPTTDDWVAKIAKNNAYIENQIELG